MARKRGGAPAGAVRQRPRPHPIWAARLEAELALERWLRQHGLDPAAVRRAHGRPRRVRSEVRRCDSPAWSWGT